MTSPSRAHWPEALGRAQQLIDAAPGGARYETGTWDHRAVRGLVAMTLYALAQLHDTSVDDVALAEAGAVLDNINDLRFIVTRSLNTEHDLSGTDTTDPVAVEWAWLTRTWIPEDELPPVWHPHRARYELWDGMPRGIARGLPDPAVNVCQARAHGIVLRALEVERNAWRPGTAVTVTGGEHIGQRGTITAAAWALSPKLGEIRYIDGPPAGYAVDLDHSEVMIAAEDLTPSRTSR